MTLETRARRAAQGVHRAVEVMEMAKSTKEPTIVEPFERFVETKQRNRRRGAILVAGGVALALLVIVAVTSLGGGSNGRAPATPGGVAPSTGARETIAGGTITVSSDGCSIDTPGTIEAFGGTVTSRLLTFEVDNSATSDAWFDLVGIDGTGMTYDGFVALTERVASRADRGKDVGSPREAMTLFAVRDHRVGAINTTSIKGGASGTIRALVTPGTYSVVCMEDLGGGELAPDTPLGPIVLT